MAVPSPETAAHLADRAGTQLVGSVFGVGLVPHRGRLENAGTTGLPGVAIDPSAGVEVGRGTRRTIVLNDVIDLDGAVDAVTSQHPEAIVVHRYDAKLFAVADGEDAEEARRRVLSTKRRKRIRSDVRKLQEKGAYRSGWIGPDELAHVFDAFAFSLAYRAAETARWDRALQRRQELWGTWQALGGRTLLVHALEAGDEVVSIRTGFRAGDTMVGHMPVVDRRDNRLSLGDVHMTELVRDMEQVGMRRYLMGKGENPHKETWATGDYRMVTLILPRGRTGLGTQAALAEQRARRALTASGAEDTIRRVLHWWFVRTDRAYREALQQAMERAEDEA